MTEVVKEGERVRGRQWERREGCVRERDIENKERESGVEITKREKRGRIWQGKIGR